MLETWEIGDFKSIGTAGLDLSTGCTTVVTGKNSIGKSSLIQSLLFTCQSLDAGGFATNGTLVRLGSPTDIIRQGERSCRVKYGFRTRYASEDRPRRVEMELRLRPKAKSGGSGSRLGICEATICIVLPDGATEQIIHCVDGRMRNEDVEYCRGAFGNFGDADILRIDQLYDAYSPRTYVVFAGFKAVAVVARKEEWWMRRTMDGIVEDLLGVGDGSRWRYSDRFLLDSLLEYTARSNAIGSKSLSRLRRMSKDALTEVDADEIRLIADAFINDRVHESYVIKRIGSTRHYLTDDVFSMVDMGEVDALVHQLEECNRNLEVGFDKIRYIGPLRDDPKSFSDVWQEPVRHCPVGKKGELTAVVLERGRNAKIEAGMPHDGFGSRSVSVADAVGAWAYYLGIGEEITHSSFQKLGTGIRVRSKRGIHDLTAVGVGASQVIPVLVGVLTSIKGAVVLLEQPEIHLHPSAQAKLADFLLFARPDLTFVIETHSEALLTRIRRRAAEGALEGREGGRGNVRILFFEEGSREAQGKTPPVSARALELNEYGNLSEWPEGFMDAVQEDSRAIMMLAARKGA